MHFFNHDLELAQLNLSQVHDIPSSHMQSLCEVGISKDFPQKKVQTRQNYDYVLPMTLNLFKLGQNQDKHLGYKQSLCEARASQSMNL